MAWIAKHDKTYGLGTDPERIEAKWYAMRATLADKPADGKVGASELEDTFMPGGYYNGYWPYLAEAFAAFVEKKNDDPLVEAYENFGAVDAVATTVTASTPRCSAVTRAGPATGRSGATTTGRCTRRRRS